MFRTQDIWSKPTPYTTPNSQVGWLTKVEIYNVPFACTGRFTMLSTNVKDLVQTQGVELSSAGN